MPLRGKQMQPRDIARLCHASGWRDLELVTAVAVCLSESNGYPRAYNDNIKDDVVLSRDVGLFEINIPADRIGTSGETDLYDPELNVVRARKLFEARGWQPWYGFTNGYATSTDWWHFSEKTKTWVPTGRYMMRALRGVSNFYAEEKGIMPVPLFPSLKPPERP